MTDHSEPNPFSRVYRAIDSWNRKRVSKQRKVAEYPFQLGVLGIMKDEEANIAEWIDHYLWQGVDRIYLIDNGSTDRSVDIVQPWVEKGVVRLISLPEPGRQRAHYRTALRKFRIARECEWLIMADIDEFWFCRDGRTIAETLPDYGYQTEVIYTNWTVFGSSGLVEHPDSVRTGFVMRQERDPAWARSARKWICRTTTLRRAQNIGLHNVMNACSGRTLTDNDRFQLNHYRIQSEEFFRKSKMQRGDATAIAKNDMRTFDYFRAIDGPCTIEDRTLADRVIRAQNETPDEV